MDADGRGPERELLDSDIRCPKCRYSWHRLAVGKCPECGLVFERRHLRGVRRAPKFERFCAAGAIFALMMCAAYPVTMLIAVVRGRDVVDFHLFMIGLYGVL